METWEDARCEVCGRAIRSGPSAFAANVGDYGRVCAWANLSHTPRPPINRAADFCTACPACASDWQPPCVTILALSEFPRRRAARFLHLPAMNTLRLRVPLGALLLFPALALLPLASSVAQQRAPVPEPVLRSTANVDQRPTGPLLGTRYAETAYAALAERG